MLTIWKMRDSSQRPSPGKVGDLHLKDCLLGRWGTHVSKPICTCQWRQRFFIRKEGNRTERWREGLDKVSTCRWAHSILVRQVMVQCASSWFSHPGFSHPGVTASWLCVWRSAHLLELGYLKVKVCIFWNYFLGFLYKHVVHLEAAY